MIVGSVVGYLLVIVLVIRDNNSHPVTPRISQRVVIYQGKPMDCLFITYRRSLAVDCNWP